MGLWKKRGIKTSALATISYKYRDGKTQFIYMDTHTHTHTYIYTNTQTKRHTAAYSHSHTHTHTHTLRNIESQTLCRF